MKHGGKSNSERVRHHLVSRGYKAVAPTKQHLATGGVVKDPAGPSTVRRHAEKPAAYAAGGVVKRGGGRPHTKVQVNVIAGHPGGMPMPGAGPVPPPPPGMGVPPPGAMPPRPMMPPAGPPGAPPGLGAGPAGPMVPPGRGI